MDFVTWGHTPWGQVIPIHAAWDLLWVSAISGLVFLVVHALYVGLAGKPYEAVEAATLQRAAAAGIPERIVRHTLAARLFHWVMAAAMFVLLVTSFLPIVGVKFAWVSLHWQAGLVLTLAVAYHVVHASFWLDFWSIWPTAAEMGDQVSRVQRSLGKPAPAPRKAAKYPFENKLYHLAILASGLAVVGTGLFMLFRVRTGLLPRNPYFLADVTWGFVYVLHGLAGIGLVALVIVHVYFAVRPEKLPITSSMIFGWMSREFYVSHHDPQRWVVASNAAAKPRATDGHPAS